MTDRMILYVQPAYNYSSNVVEYLEVLIRGYRGIESAWKIMKFVELSKIEDVFDMDVLHKTLEVLNEYERIDCPVGVNLCPSTIAKEGMADNIISILKNENKSDNDIVIEINEKTDFKDKTVRSNMHKLRENGIKIALDDFGVESSNLYTLLGCNIDILKVDKVFIDSTGTEYEESQSKILKNLLQICKDFNLKHIVEGIETKRQLDSIERLGYSVVQGYLYERPMPLIQLLDSRYKKLEEN